MQKADNLTQVHSTEAPQRSEKHQQEVQQLQQHHSLGGRQAGRVRHPAGDHRVGHGHRVSGEKADSSLPGVKLISINQKSTICVKKMQKKKRMERGRSQPIHLSKSSKFKKKS